MTAAEVGTFAALLLLLGAAVFGSHVKGATFYSDDWSSSALYAFSGGSGLGGALEHGLSLPLFSYRPVLAVLLALPHELLGTRTDLHLAMAVVLGVLTSACFFLLLRMLGMERLHAGAIAALALLFPASDAARLWPTAAMNNVAVSLYLLGAVVALRALAASGSEGTRLRRAAALHAVAVALYVLSVLTYELTAGAVLVSAVLYARRASWRRALSRAALDAAAVGGALVMVVANTPRAVQPLATALEHAGAIASESLTLLASAAVPYGGSAWEAGGAWWGLGGPGWTSWVGGWLGGALLALGVGGAALGARTLGRDDPAHLALRRWLCTAGAGGVGIAAGYLMLVPAAPHYLPLGPGVFNRVNVLAALGFVTLVYALAMLLGTLASRVLAGSTRWATPLAALAALAVGLGYAREVEADKASWARSSTEQRQVLWAIERIAPRPPSGATIYAFGQATWAAPGVPVFRHWDLNGAVKLTAHDPSLAAYPVYPGTSFACGHASLHPSSKFYGEHQAAPYGKAIFLDVVTGRAALIRERSSCRAQRERFRPGPWSRTAL